MKFKAKKGAKFGDIVFLKEYYETNDDKEIKILKLFGVREIRKKPEKGKNIKNGNSDKD